jgi:hypothetical protein
MKFGDLFKEKKYNMKLISFLLKTVITSHDITVFDIIN